MKRINSNLTNSSDSYLYLEELEECRKRDKLSRLSRGEDIGIF
jgi:hypothetical protein